MAKYTEILNEKRDAALARAEQITQIAVSEQRDLSKDEDNTVAVALDEVRELDEQIKQHTELEGRAAAAAEARKNTTISAPAVVKSEARTYSPQAEASFIADAYAAQFNNDFSAKDRLARHMQEEKIERRDVTSANFAGLVVPQFLTDLAAPFARAGRPFLDVARKHQLPAQGLTISISKVTTGSATAVQTEGAAVQETNMDDTKLDVSVVTVAGQQNVSRQALERGTGIDSLVMADLVSAYHTNLDSLFVTTSATSLTNVITQVVTYTDASPSVAELYPKLLDAIQRVQTHHRLAGGAYGRRAVEVDDEGVRVGLQEERLPGTCFADHEAEHAPDGDAPSDDGGAEGRVLGRDGLSGGKGMGHDDASVEEGGCFHVPGQDHPLACHEHGRCFRHGGGLVELRDERLVRRLLADGLHLARRRLVAGDADDDLALEPDAELLAPLAERGHRDVRAVVLVEEEEQGGAGLDVVPAPADDLRDLRRNHGLEDLLLELHEWVWTAHAMSPSGTASSRSRCTKFSPRTTSGHTTGSVSMKGR